LNKQIGTLIDRLNPKLSDRHMTMIKKIYGPNAPQVIVLKNDSVHSNAVSSPGDFAAIAFVYVIWMLLKQVIFYLVL